MSSLVDYDSDSDLDTVPEKPQKPLLNLPAPKRGNGPRQVIVESVKKDQLPEQNEKKEKEEINRKRTSLASLLPKPKNRKVEKDGFPIEEDDIALGSVGRAKSIPKDLFQRRSKILGGAAGKMFDGDIEPVIQSGADYDLSENKRIKIIPASVLINQYKRGKTAKSESSAVSDPSKDNSGPSIPDSYSPSTSPGSARPDNRPDISNLFAIGSGSSVIGPAKPSANASSSSSSFSYQPVFVREEYIEEQQVELAESAASISQPAKAETDKVIEFNADDFYQHNIDLKRRGELQERKAPIRAIGSGKHQLSAVIANAQREHEGLEEKYAQTRKKKQQSRTKYGL
ncbi:hypothetical protein TRVA0_004S04280 [Trichomonascus vanleenenianus]|uniref:PRCC domain-containing protein n=1 Tax=Trichomonascus vanleenenianus TaxID=2268995 RepID=UPI003ECB4A93